MELFRQNQYEQSENIKKHFVTWSNCNAAPDIRKRYIRAGRLLRRPELPEKLSENFEGIGVAGSSGEGSLPVGKMDRFDPEI